MGGSHHGDRGGALTHREEAPTGRWARPSIFRAGRACADTLMVYRRNAERRSHLERDHCFECKRFIPTGAIGRCDWCFVRRPSALALQVGKHRVEYLQEMLDAMPAAQRSAVERSPNRIR